MKWALFVFLLMSGEAWAHGFSRSVSSWQVEGNSFAVEFSAPLLAAESVPYGRARATPTERFQDHLQKTILLSAEGVACAWQQNKARVAGDRIFAALKMKCPHNRELKIIMHSFFDSDPSHVHFARVHFSRVLSGENKGEFIFSNSNRVHEINLSGTQPSSTWLNTLFSYTALGVKHILEGIDHLAFVVALLLVCGFSRQVIWAVTGFTLGHSLTLGLASSGFVVADIPMVEALIGWTILLMALERSGLLNHNFREVIFAQAAVLGVCLCLSFFVPSQLTAIAFLGLIIFSLAWGGYIQNEQQARRMVPILSVGFGLIHGLGFAAVLTEIGLPQDYFLLGLLGFNIGVELGQLFFIALLLASVLLLGKSKKGQVAFSLPVQQTLASLLVFLGAYWFFGRNFF